MLVNVPFVAPPKMDARSGKKTATSELSSWMESFPVMEGGLELRLKRLLTSTGCPSGVKLLYSLQPATAVPARFGPGVLHPCDAMWLSIVELMNAMMSY